MVASVPRWDLWPLMWIALVPALHVSLTSTRSREAFLGGWLAGFLGNAGGFSWMLGFFQHFGHMPVWESAPIFSLLIGYQGLMFAVWSWGVFVVRQKWPRVPLFVIAPVVMAAVELPVPQIFPYSIAISQAWVPTVIQLAELGGPVVVTFAMLVVNGALYELYEVFRERPQGPEQARGLLRRGRGPLLAIVATVLFTVGFGRLRIHMTDARMAAAPKVKVGLVQANIGIDEKWDPGEAAHNLAVHQEASKALAAAGADLLVWPESSYPYALPRDIRQDAAPESPYRLMRDFATPTLFGTVTLARQRTGKDRFPYNTALMMSGDGRIVGTFDKVFLMMFGEYIPFYDQIPWFTQIFPEASNFARGSEPTVFPFAHGGRSYKLAPLICYEDILAGWARKVAALEPDLFVNITNDAWFGPTAEPYQHLALAVYRAVEHRTPMVRAVNTGVSAAIDANGRVVASLPARDPAEHPSPSHLLAEVPLLAGHGLYGVFGDAFGLVCTALAALAAFGDRVRRPARRRSGDGTAEVAAETPREGAGAAVTAAGHGDGGRRRARPATRSRPQRKKKG